MSKKKTPRSLQDHQACANLRTIRVSPQKLNLVAQMIRGLQVGKALHALQYSPKRIAQDVRKTLLSAVASAENNHQLDIDKLHVTEATVGQSLVMKRVDFKGRSRMGRIRKPFSHLRLVVSEVEEVA